MEHITNHLKAEAQNNVEFRALIGEARMGKVSIGTCIRRACQQYSHNAILHHRNSQKHSVKTMYVIIDGIVLGIPK